MKYIALIWQEQGCDYTIGCGIDMLTLKANNMNDARMELFEKIADEYSSEERELSGATIYAVETENEIDIKSVYDDIRKAREIIKSEKRKEQERKEYERLKAKLGL